jgi:hypothetical protein
MMFALGLAVSLGIGACSRGPNPPQPTEDLRSTLIGIVSDDGSSLTLESGRSVPMPGTGQIMNWPARAPEEEPEIRPGALVLAGQRPDGSSWFEVAGSFGPGQDDCWPIY